MSDVPIPYVIRRESEQRRIAIQWDELGRHVGTYECRALRLACPCALCVDEASGRPTLDPVTVPEDVRASEIRLIGGYAVKFVWSDGHDIGIYPYEHLLKLCPCPRCRPAPGAGGP